MKRTPLKRKTPLKRSQKPLKRSPLRKVSSKQSKRLTAYSKAKQEYAKEHPICEVKGCASLAQDLHHKAGRGSKIADKEYFMAICRYHHSFCHANPSWARANGYLV